MTTDQEIAEVGEKMLAILDEHGWCQDVLHTPDGKVCLRGALFQALTGAPRWLSMADTRWTTYEVIDLRLDAFIEDENLPLNPGDEDTVPAFNNEAHTTVEDVKLLIKRALIEPSLE